jgi:hypothetical protein
VNSSPGVDGPHSVGGDNVWLKGADGEAQAIGSTAAILTARTR